MPKSTEHWLERIWNSLGGAVGAVSVDITDRATRILGVLSANPGVNIGDVNVTDRVDRVLGLVELQDSTVGIAPIVGVAADVNAPAVNTAAVVTYGAAANAVHAITGVAWSYDGGIPVGGNLLIEDVAGTTVFSIDITEEGPGFFIFPNPKRSAVVNTAMIITLAAGGAGITGKLSILNHWQV